MGRATELAERVAFVTLHEAGWTDRAIAQHTAWSVATVRKWRRRYQQAGRGGLGSAMGRPRRGPLSDFGAEVSQTLHRWRAAHPGWGPKTLHQELRQQAAFAGQRVPSAASIGRWLKAEKLTRVYERHSELPQPPPQLAQRVHHLWQMDARGYDRVPAVGGVSLVQLNDCLSHARLLSFPVWLGPERPQRYVQTDDYQAALRLAFSEWGLPERVQVDRDPVFCDPKGKSPFPSRLHLWLLALGIDLVFGRAYRPQDQGLTERSHQLWATQCLVGQQFDDWQDLFLALHQRRDFLNYQLPCASLDDQPPLVAFPQAAHSGRDYRPEWETDLLDLERLWPFLAQGRWFRQTGANASFSLAKQRYSVGMPHAHMQLEITFDPLDQHLLCHDPTGALLRRLPIKGLSKATLMGELAPYAALPCFQLHLPLTWQDFRVLRLFETIGS